MGLKKLGRSTLTQKLKNGIKRSLLTIIAMMKAKRLGLRVKFVRQACLRNYTL